MPMDTKPGRVVIYNELPSIKSPDPLIIYLVILSFYYTICRSTMQTFKYSPASCFALNNSFFSNLILKLNIEVDSKQPLFGILNFKDIGITCAGLQFSMNYIGH